MSRTMISTLAVALTLAGAGCFRTPGAPSIDGDPSYYPPSDPYGSTTGALVVENGQQSGDMGNIRGFSGTAVDMSGYGSTYTSTNSNVRLDSVGTGWWAMSSLHIYGDLAGPDFAPGTHRTFTSAVWSDGEPTVSVTGCSGPEYGNYTFDSSDGAVEISVEARANGMRRMNYSVRFSDGAVTTGSFDYRVDATGSGSTRSGI